MSDEHRIAGNQMGELSIPTSLDDLLARIKALEAWRELMDTYEQELAAGLIEEHDAPRLLALEVEVRKLRGMMPRAEPTLPRPLKENEYFLDGKIWQMEP